MKIRNIAAILAVTASAAAIGWICVDLHQDLDDVNIISTDLAGDPSALEGVSLTIRTGLSDICAWTTEYDPVTKTSATTFEASPAVEETENFPEKYMYVNMLGEVTSSGAMSLAELPLTEEESKYELGGYPVSMLRDFAEHAGNSEEYSETFRLKDYTDIIPMDLSLEWPIQNEVKNNEDYSYLWLYSADEIIGQTLMEMMALPAEDDITVTIHRHQDSMTGDIVTDLTPERLRYSTVSCSKPLEKQMAFVLQTTDCETSEPVSGNSMHNKLCLLDMEKVKELDTAIQSTIENGSAYPDVTRRKDYVAEQLKDALTELTAIPEGFEIVDLDTSLDEAQFYLYGIQSEEYMLLVIDAKSGNILQSLSLGALCYYKKSDEDGVMHEYPYTDYLINRVVQEDALIINDENGGMLVLRPAEDGTLYIWLNADEENSKALPWAAELYYDEDEEEEDNIEAEKPDEEPVRSSDGIGLIAPSLVNCQFQFVDDRLILVGWTKSNYYNQSDEHFYYNVDQEYVIAHDDNTVAHGVAEICVFTAEGLQYKGLAEVQGCGRISFGNPMMQSSLSINA